MAVTSSSLGLNGFEYDSLVTSNPSIRLCIVGDNTPVGGYPSEFHGVITSFALAMSLSCDNLVRWTIGLKGGQMSKLYGPDEGYQTVVSRTALKKMKKTKK
jgi:hypothetical protein